jgi:hypothetical protein
MSFDRGPSRGGTAPPSLLRKKRANVYCAVRYVGNARGISEVTTLGVRYSVLSPSKISKISEALRVFGDLRMANSA